MVQGCRPLSPEDRSALVCQSLDCMHMNRQPFATQYDLMGPSWRAYGSFGTVLLARTKDSGVRVPARGVSVAT